MFIDLPKFTKKTEWIIGNYGWELELFFQEETTNEDLRKIAEKSPIIKLAYDEIDQFSWEEEDLEAYEERVMSVQKEAAIWEQCLDDATAKGLKIGRQGRRPNRSRKRQTRRHPN